MAAPSEKTQSPFTAFNFLVEIQVPQMSGDVCSAGFNECAGLEMTVAHKTLREGGNNNTQIHLAGPVSYGQLTLKRGMTTNFDLWEWFTMVHSLRGRSIRGDGEVIMMAADGETVQARFILSRCMPTKLRAPTLNAKEGFLAIEEMQLVYERMTLKSKSQ